MCRALEELFMAKGARIGYWRGSIAGLIDDIQASSQCSRGPVERCMRPSAFVSPWSVVLVSWTTSGMSSLRLVRDAGAAAGSVRRRVATHPHVLSLPLGLGIRPRVRHRPAS